MRFIITYVTRYNEDFTNQMNLKSTMAMKRGRPIHTLIDLAQYMKRWKKKKKKTYNK